MDSVDLILDVQERLIKKITYAEQRIRRLKLIVKEKRKNLRSTSSLHTKQTARQTKDTLFRLEGGIDNYQELLGTLRFFGDAIAFSFMDVWDIKPIGVGKEGAGFISGKKGSRLERQILRKLCERKIPTILNDLTNCLRYADITAFPPDRKFVLLEAKSGKNRTQRDRKQMDRLEKVSSYLEKDETEGLYKIAGQMKRVSSQSNPYYNRKEINSVLEKALQSENCVEEVEPGLFYWATTNLDMSVLGDVDSKCHGKKTSAIVDRNFYVEFPFYPIALSIQNFEIFWRFCRNQMFIIVIVDLDVMKKRLESSGLLFEIIDLKPQQGSQEWIFEIRNPRANDDQLSYMKISNSYFARIYAEFLSYDWIVSEIISGFKTNRLIEAFS